MYLMLPRLTLQWITDHAFQAGLAWTVLWRRSTGKLTFSMQQLHHDLHGQ